MALVSGVHPANEDELRIKVGADGFEVTLVFLTRRDAEDLIRAFHEQNMSPSEHWERARQAAIAAGVEPV